MFRRFKTWLMIRAYGSWLLSHGWSPQDAAEMMQRAEKREL